MNSPLEPINLAREADLRIGAAAIRPALRLFTANGADEVVEPRVMQVLVALARRAGEVVGRDDLVALCWEGRVIGEDAIQRAVARVRKLGETSGAYAVETIPKVGYRLIRLGADIDARQPVNVAAERSELRREGGARSVVSPQSARPSLAVLPFINRTDHQEDDDFADGLVEDITAALSSSTWTNAVAASAAAIYRQGARDLRQIGRDLGARYLLEGNLRRAGASLRVTAQLVEAEGGNILWTRKFECPVAELSEFQESLSADVAAELSVQVQRAEMERAIKDSGDTSAWAALMRANTHTTYATRSEAEAAVAEAKRAVGVNPHDGLAYANLASYQGLLLHHRGGDDPQLSQEIADNIRRGRALDPDNLLVLESVAVALAWMRKPEEALPFAERAIAISPNSDFPRFILGLVLARLGRSDDAIAELDAAEKFAPNGLWLPIMSQWRSIAHLQAGRLEQALEAANRCLRLAPGSDSLIQSMLCLAELNEWRRARDALRRLREIEPDMSRALLENLVRDLHYVHHAVEDYVVTVCRLWDEAAEEAGG